MSVQPASTGEQILPSGAVDCAHTKFALIGAGPGRVEAPWGDPTWCVQALNEIAQPSYDRHWEMHPRAVQSPQDFAWLAQCQAPCYVLDPDEWAPGEIAHPIRYPLEWILDVTGGRRYFTCTFAYQLAFAIAEGFAEIGLWGMELDLGTARERLIEKPCVEYWAGLAEGRGIRLTLSRGTTLLRRDYLYGYDYHAEKDMGDALCDQIVLTTPRARWPALLQTLGYHYGGALERAMLTAATELGRARETTIERR